MRVPLYARIYDNYKGFTLPPPSALERFMKEVGVSSKQTDKARTAFMRSAKQAGFFMHGEDRLVRPAIKSPGTKPIDGVSSDNESKESNNKLGGPGGPKDPLLIALIQKLPEKGPWPADDRIMWLRMIAMAFQMAYGQEDEIEVGLRQKPKLENGYVRS